MQISRNIANGLKSDN